MPAPEEPLTVAATARRVGVAPATLRTWDRRYGLGPSEHQAGAHRRYCALDVARLMMMRRLISTGVAPCQAAEIAKSDNGKTPLAKIKHSFQSRDELVSAVFKAVQICDSAFTESELKKDVTAHGVVSSWSEVIAPLLILVGKTWEETDKGIAAEHLLTEIIKNVLRDSIKEIKIAHNAQPVLLAAVGQEIHCLALHALVAALAERRIKTHYLGARTPMAALSTMVSRSAPPAVFLWAQLKENAQPEFFRGLPDVRPAPRIVLGGPGWDRNECSDVAFVEDLEQACQEIGRAVGL